MTDEPIDPLRQRMIEDMTVRSFNAPPQSGYIRAVKKLAVVPKAHRLPVVLNPDGVTRLLEAAQILNTRPPSAWLMELACASPRSPRSR